MRAFALVALSALSLAAAVPAASAAELALPNGGCARGQVWDGYRCAWPAPQARPYYNAPQAYGDDDEDEYVAEAPVYEAPPVYSYAVPYYRPPVFSLYAYAGPRYYWGGHRHRWH